MQKIFVLIFYCSFHEILLLLIVKGGAINFDALHQLLYLCLFDVVASIPTVQIAKSVTCMQWKLLNFVH